MKKLTVKFVFFVAPKYGRQRTAGKLKQGKGEREGGKGRLRAGARIRYKNKKLYKRLRPLFSVCPKLETTYLEAEVNQPKV